ncbi:VOC family protein [Paracoccus sp. (in: a-proteobacteria)]|uniref:VOC family protein n=1 Tax=Paracoccus sp. TaxID=267 RepID=UPI003A86B61B
MEEQMATGISGLHHAAYRCKDAKETVEFYRKYLDLDFNIAVAENYVPSTGEWSPHIHIFLQMADGSFVAFFELPEDKGNILDDETPKWVQHLALKVPDMKTLEAYKARLVAGGVDVLGPTDHTICQSIYFFDPSGHRLELAIDTTSAEMGAKLREAAPATLEEWSRTKRAPDVDPMHANARN